MLLTYVAQAPFQAHVAEIPYASWDTLRVAEMSGTCNQLRLRVAEIFYA